MPGSDGEALEAVRLADQAAMRLLDQPGDAEKYLRQALSRGEGILPPEHLARLSSQLVMVISGQRGRETELAAAAREAATRWAAISEADAMHLTFVAARALHRAGQHSAAAAAFAVPFTAGAAPYPPAEMALVLSQYGRSLKLLGRYREAAHQFIEGARLVQPDPARRELHAELTWSAASALDCGGEDDQAQLVYRRAAQLWGDLGQVTKRARCLRSAAWLQFWSNPADSGGPAAMRGLLAELEQLERTEPSAAIRNELAHTRRQLADMEEQ
ncbi:hypothetical protein [Nocardia goodfellowii]|uniref:Tetratricopeptide (TPR) repeat protein n=1 Tax=Nocardia goodfellowii TaxID=882446 RepID=A0ABS4QQW0_9NOCA|nr:hypothetical protein [Nocardia goodfellowii]MBP2194092.1 tetratricopeptide (TPR) repeat protein [Nocardia goodfellowii]